eukprot:3166530-Pleurochrysis_carterae.AAC.2
MNGSYCLEVCSVSSEMYWKDTSAIRPERVIKNVLVRLSNDLYRFERGHGWGSRLMADLIETCHWHYPSKRLVLRIVWLAISRRN